MFPGWSVNSSASISSLQRKKGLKMRFPISTSVLSLLLASSLAADEAQVHFDGSSSPSYSSMPISDDNIPFCIHSTDAAVIGRDFGLLISNYTNELAVRLLAEGFTDQADSVNTLINNSPLPDQEVCACGPGRVFSACTDIPNRAANM